MGVFDRDYAKENFDYKTMSYNPSKQKTSSISSSSTPIKNIVNKPLISFRTFLLFCLFLGVLLGLKNIS